MDEVSSSSGEWPSYHRATKDATFALGVISTGYGRLEFAFGALFANVLNLPSNFVAALFPKLGNEMRIALVTELLPQMQIDPEIEDHVRYFIKGFEALAFNRNMLMHSELISGGVSSAFLLKTQRNGMLVGCSVTTRRLQSIADDLETFHQYGITLANLIALPLLKAVLAIEESPPPGLSALPDKPPLPSRLEYTSGPLPVRPSPPKDS